MMASYAKQPPCVLPSLRLCCRCWLAVFTGLLKIVEGTLCCHMHVAASAANRLVDCRQSDKAHSDAEALKKRTAEDNQQYDQLTSALKDVEAQYRQAGEPLL